jgi:hypothetical protein
MAGTPMLQRQRGHRSDMQPRVALLSEKFSLEKANKAFDLSECINKGLTFLKERQYSDLIKKRYRGT